MKITAWVCQKCGTRLNLPWRLSPVPLMYVGDYLRFRCPVCDHRWEWFTARTGRADETETYGKAT